MKILVEVNTEKENEYVYSKIQYNERHVWRNCKRFLNIDDGSYYQSKSCAENNGYNIISFNEFKSRYEPQLKIGDTFVYNGFICRVESQVKKWYKIEDNKNNKVAFEKLCKQDVLDIKKLPYAILTEITNKEFIKQLEENAR